MQLSISHDRRDESTKAKARWFQSLPVSERMEIFCSFTDLALSLNPALMEKKDAKPASGSVRILKLDKGDKKEKE